MQAQPLRILTAIKLCHTVVWLFFVLCIAAVPVCTAQSRFRAAAIFSAIVLVECLVLALNRFRCPLTDLAARYTPERHDNFDIYLPLWLARYNKLLFGTLFAVSLVFLLVRWLAVHAR